MSPIDATDPQLRVAAAELDGLRRQVRGLQVRTRILAVAFISIFLLGTRRSAGTDGPTGDARFRELTVERINIAGSDGVRRYILSHEAPKAPFAGREFERSVPPGMAAMVMLDPKGNEVGGWGSSELHTMFALDYRDYPLEAVILGTGFGADGAQSAGIYVKQPPVGGPLDMDAVARGFEKHKQGTSDPGDPDTRELQRFAEMQRDRIEILASAQQSAIGLKDSKGRLRIQVLVDENDSPAIVMFDADGQEMARLPSVK